MPESVNTVFYDQPVPYYEDMCDNVSEMLVRANPKLSTNVKVMTNGDFVMLESFDACKEISGSKYKNFKTYTKSKYNSDIAKFWKNTDKVHAYSVLQEFDDTSVKSSFDQQYETFYWSGCEYIDSLEYDEPYGILAPLWIDKKLPKKFIVFRVTDPSYWNFITHQNEQTESFDFIRDILDQCEIIKTFDLTSDSKIGTYINNYVSQNGFPDSPLTVTDEYISFNGISYSKGEFTSVNEYCKERFWNHDDNVIEFDKYITEGFERNGIVVANIMNIEFLFDDKKAGMYEFTRYFGLYCDFIEDGKFKINKEDLYGKNNNYAFDINSFDIYNDNNFITSNSNGVNIPAEILTEDSLLPIYEYAFEINGIFCLQDINGQLHSISRTNGYEDDIYIQDIFKLKETETDLNVFKGLKEKVDTITCTYEDNTTPSSLILTVKDQMPQNAKLVFFRITSGIENTVAELYATLDNQDLHYGENDYDLFCCTGQVSDIAKAICKAFNTVTDTGIKAYYCDDKVYFISPNSSPAYNFYGIRLVDCSNPEDLVGFSNSGMFCGSNQYDHIKCHEDLIDTFSVGDYIISKSHNGFNKIISIVVDFDNVKISDDKITFPDGIYYDILLDSEGVIVYKTNQTKIYTEFNPSFGRLIFFPVRDLEMSTYHDVTKYGDMGELNYELEYILKNSHEEEPSQSEQESLSSIPFNIDAVDFVAVFENLDVNIDPNDYEVHISDPQDVNPQTDEYTLEVTLNLNVLNANYINNILNDNTESIFKFDTLSTTLNVSELTYLNSEYARCHENFNPHFMTLSKTQPWICNWVMKDGKDVREKPYRLNTNPVFGQYSFTPEHTNYEPNPICYNQEWMYIFDKSLTDSLPDQRNIWSYIGEPIDRTDLENNLKSTKTNWFDVYFKRDHIRYIGNISDKPDFYSTPDYMRKYSLLYNGSKNTNAETFFRGAKLEFIMKSDWDEELDNNIDNIKTKYGNDLNGYKFTAVCVPLSIDDGSSISDLKIKVIRNDVFKTITFIKYIVKEYTDALDVLFEHTQQHTLKIDEVNRYNMYVSNDKENALQKPISIKGSGNITELIIDSYGNAEITGEGTSFINDFHIYDENQAVFEGDTYYKEILVINHPEWAVTYPTYIHCMVIRITDIESDTKMFGTVRDIPNNPDNCDIFSQLQNYLFVNDWDNYNINAYYILNVNYSQFASNLESCVFASIKHTINNTQKDQIEYELIDKDGNDISESDKKYPYAIHVVSPMNNAKYEYMSLMFDGEYITNRISPSHAAPMYRYTGRFTPLRNDVLYFTDPYIEEISGGGSIDETRQKFFTSSRHLNTCFDMNISDFGILHDIAFHRANENNNNVFKLTGDQKPLYPTSNRFSIGKRDINVFNSSWDPWYFTRTLSNTLEEDCHGTLSMKENKAFFGSKCLSVPEELHFDSFTYEEYVEDTIQDSDVLYLQKGSHIELYVNIEKILTAKLRNDLYDLFSQYIDSRYSYGDKSTIEDDITTYIQQNLLKLYQFDELRLWVKEEASSKDKIVWTTLMSNDHQKKLIGLKPTNVMGLSSLNGSRLDKKVVYNIKKGKKYHFGIDFTITKK